MRQVILDTSFIMSSVKHKLDFFDKIEKEGFKIIIPNQVIKELEGLGESLALKILERNNFKSIKLEGKDADTAIVNFTKKNPKTTVATLDKGLQKRIKGKKMIIRQKKMIEII